MWEAIQQIVCDDITRVDSISASLMLSASRSFERKHSLEYRLGKVFESLLGTENLTETVAKAEGLNSKLIEMLGALNREKSVKPSVGGNVMLFAKKD